MTLSSTTITTSESGLFEELLDDETNEVLCIGLNESQTAAFIDVLSDVDDPPEVNFFTTTSVLKWVRDDFVLASEAANLLEAGILSIRATDQPIRNVLVVLDNAVVSLVTAGELIAGFVADDEDFAEAVTEKWTAIWDEGEEFSLRTPGRSRVEASLEETFGPELARDFRTMLNALESTRGDGFDEVAVSLLVMAKHEELLYDVSKWGESVGVASKASFSREKKKLEERGLIETEKVPIDVGRPRLRLVLPEKLQDATAEELPVMAHEITSSDSF